MPRRKKKDDDEQAGAPAWMVTYGDMMTLLLTFFVLLLSFSTISEEKLEQAMSSVLRSLGVLPANTTVVQIFRKTVPQVPQRLPRRVERVARELQRMMSVIGREEDVDIEYDRETGLKISLPSNVLFDLGRAQVRPEAGEILTGLGQLLAEIPGKFVEVRGHTDNLPLGPNSDFADNRELSYHRANNVVDYMIQRTNLEPDEFEVVACGEWQPKAPNTTEEGRQANRRVEFQVRGEFEEGLMRDVREAVDDMTRPGVMPETPAAPEAPGVPGV